MREWAGKRNPSLDTMVRFGCLFVCLVVWLFGCLVVCLVVWLFVGLFDCLFLQINSHNMAYFKNRREPSAKSFLNANCQCI